MFNSLISLSSWILWQHLVIHGDMRDMMEIYLYNFWLFNFFSFFFFFFSIFILFVFFFPLRCPNQTYWGHWVGHLLGVVVQLCRCGREGLSWTHNKQPPQTCQRGLFFTMASMIGLPRLPQIWPNSGASLLARSGRLSGGFVVLGLVGSGKNGVLPLEFLVSYAWPIMRSTSKHTCTKAPSKALQRGFLGKPLPTWRSAGLESARQWH